MSVIIEGLRGNAQADNSKSIGNCSSSEDPVAREAEPSDKEGFCRVLGITVPIAVYPGRKVTCRKINCDYWAASF